MITCITHLLSDSFISRSLWSDSFICSYQEPVSRMEVLHTSSALRPAAWRTGNVTPPTSNLQCPAAARCPWSRGGAEVASPTFCRDGDAPDHLVFNPNRVHGPPSGLCERHQVSSLARQVLVFIPVRSAASQALFFELVSLYVHACLNSCI
jgi:hypothetical protein